MTIDEAIEHAKEVARTCDDDQCAAEHIQLAEWLRRARGAEKAGRWSTSKIRELEAKNAKLREEIKAANHDLSLFSGELVASKFENAKLRELACEIYEDQCDDCDRWKYRDRMRELGAEVDE